MNHIDRINIKHTHEYEREELKELFSKMENKKEVILLSLRLASHDGYFDAENCEDLLSEIVLQALYDLDRAEQVPEEQDCSVKFF